MMKELSKESIYQHIRVSVMPTSYLVGKGGGGSVSGHTIEWDAVVRGNVTYRQIG